MVVHDVTPVLARDVDAILDCCLPEVGEFLAGAAVPCWHGQTPGATDRQRFRRWLDQFGETLLHGWTHWREHRPGLISLLTNRADELAGLSTPDVAERIGRGLSLLQDITGAAVTGFVPPAWQLPSGLEALRQAGLEYSVGFTRLSSIHSADIPLATWSWDWGRIAFVSRLGASLGSAARLCNHRAVPVIVLHPADVGRGLLPAAVGVIRRLKSAGWQPTRIEHLLSNAGRKPTA
ncbi:MAG: hypothetical protein EHM42_14030 [Planctomycetaceae bacterium]|nr:MAG: hypothetical protein EHM42_14030 [Planctomycetaceae bacterium]